MKPSIYRRIRRRPASHETVNTNKESKQEQSFFGGSLHETFFQPSPAIQRKCDDCEKEEKQVQRQPEKKEDEKKLMKKEDLSAVAPAKEEEKKEEKLMKKEDKKEEEVLQKKEDKKEEEKIQKKDAGGNSTSPITSSYVGSLNSKGAALPKQTHQFFGERMGYDFSNVKVHTDKEASQSAKEVNAKAYTVGNNIVFNEGQYNTESSEGKKLMAHELTHVMQQQENGKQESANRQLQRKVAYSTPAYKKEDPIPKIIGAGKGNLGKTFITLNGKKLITKNDAMKAVFEAFNNNLSLIHDASAKKCTVDTSKVNIDISAEITLPTDPVSDKWTGSYPGSIVTGSATCSKLPTVKIEMVAVPSGGAMLAGSIWIDEMQHYADILDLSKKHIETYHTYLDNLSFTANTPADCPVNFSTEIANKDIIMAQNFADAWLAAVQVYDKPGGTHHYSSVTNATNCNLVTVTVSF